MAVQNGSHMENTESKGLEWNMGDETSGSAEFSGVGKADLLALRHEFGFPDLQLLDFRI